MIHLFLKFTINFMYILNKSFLSMIKLRIPNWREEQLKKIKSQGYYHLHFPEFED